MSGRASSAPRSTDTTLDPTQSRWLAKLWRQQRTRFIWAVAAPLLVGLLLVVQVGLLAQVLGGVINHDLPGTDSWPWIAGIAGLVLLRAVLSFSGERAASRAAEAIKAALRQALFKQLLAHGPHWTRQQVSGELASALVDQVEQLDGFLSRYQASAIAAVFLPLAFGLVLLPLDWLAALIMLLTAPLIPVFMALVGWGAEAASQRHQQEMTRLSGVFTDRLRGAFTLRLFGRADDETTAMRDASQRLSQRTMAVLRIAFLSSAVLEFFAALGVAAMALYIGLSYLGYLQFRAEAISLPLGLFALFMAPEVYNPLRQMAANYHDRAAARAAVGQIDQLFGGLPNLAADPAHPLVLATQEVSDARYWTPAAARDASIQLRGLSLPGRHPDEFLLRDITLHMQAGEHLAIMGHSGVGKTTLLETLVGLRGAGLGQLSLLGQSRTLTPDGPAQPHPALGKDLAYIGQRPFFLAGSVADNLHLVAPDAPEADLLQALDQACALDFVLASPLGLHMPLGEAAYGLSGGQRQRLALARLFLLNPALVVLDEPTAHLDADTSRQLMASLQRFCAGRTLIVATHDIAAAHTLGRRINLDELKDLPDHAAQV
ncbi:thiol reductant ABC exporter subunit CydD [Castellaniella sp.]|uniref:thiol reductant ABC exporter subunit CydD n=1 Tax=Castellaniella sp. TaxID=1955812 RepID=UPI002AFE0787|nr:thiol reductant ABC exporter subunit CydD [Castellaniella sp.]